MRIKQIISNPASSHLPGRRRGRLVRSYFLIFVGLIGGGMLASCVSCWVEESAGCRAFQTRVDLRWGAVVTDSRGILDSAIAARFCSLKSEGLLPVGVR